MAGRGEWIVSFREEPTMAMVVKNNLQAKNTLNQLEKNEKAKGKNLKSLASGMKINSAGDDASGLSISERMEVQIRGLDQDNDNAQTGANMLKTAEGAVSSTVDILRTLKEKAINAANDTNTDADRATIQKEFDQAIDQIDDNANVTYNGKYLVDGSHNSKTDQTTTALTNESLDAKTVAGSALTAIKNRNGELLNIHSTDNVTISYVQEGKTYSTTFQVSSNTLEQALKKTAYNGKKTLKDALSIKSSTATSTIGKDGSGNKITTADNGCAITLTAKTGGVNGQISGFTISITTNKGNVNKSANAVLDNFSESIRAQNKSDDNSFSLQVGTKANQSIKVGLTDMRSQALGLKGKDGQTLNVSTQVKANAAINVLDNAVQKALDQQTTIGSVESRLSYTASNLTTASENVQASESTIRDADMAKEMTEYTKNNVLLQAAQSMLAQANQSSSSVLSLLQ